MPILKPSPDFVIRTSGKIVPNGFTLAELLVVLAIMSLAAILFIGAGGSGKGIERKTAVAKLQRVVAETHQIALQTAKNQSVDLSRFEARLKPVLGDQSKKIIFYSDGSTNGGVISSGGQRLFEVRWIDGVIVK